MTGTTTNIDKPAALSAGADLSKIPEGSHRVTVMRDTSLAFPELWLEVFVTGSPYEQKQFAEMFARARCYRADSPLTADLVVFAGGPDVDPGLYGEEPHCENEGDKKRDEEDIKLWKICHSLGIPMFGVCRGAQFLHVMNGGKLFQHVDGHQGRHTMFDVKERRLMQSVSSVHHQMCMPNLVGGRMDILAVSHKSNKRWTNDNCFETGRTKDIEAYYYRDTACLGVQGHPEYRGYAEYTAWCLKQIEDYIVNCPDMEKKAGTGLRLKQDVLLERTMKEIN
jgi:gamma-glutamyl-gamma-aminobutyrate hydrolase PuuD